MKKKREFPHSFVILFFILALMTALTWILPAGQYDSVTVNGVSAVDPNSFHYVENTPVGIFDFFKAIPLGIQNGIALICMILTIGASIGLVDETGAIRAALVSLTKTSGEKSGKFVLAGMMVFFLCIGAFPSMLEGVIPFIPIGVAVALMLGYDVVTGVAVVFVADIVGWAAGPTNLYTVGNAQTIGGLELFSGLGYRMVSLVVLGAIAIWFVLRYAERVKKDPTKGIMYGEDYSDLKNASDAQLEFTLRRKLILVVFIATIALVVYGSLEWGWGLFDMAAVYLICGIVCGLIAGFKSGKIADTLLAGAQSVFIAAMAIGLARGISIVMDNGQITYTVVHALSGLVANVPTAVTGIAMLAIQTVLNFFIPSGSSQALVTMPILMPMAEIVGLSKQMTILAFQFGDGLSNLGFPTMGALIACLTYARIPFNKWFKFILPFLGIAYAACAILIVISSFIGY